MHQPGYLSYSLALPAFIAANENRKMVTIAATGYPLTIKQGNLIPIDFPKTFIKVKKNKKMLYKGEYEEFMARPDGVSYLATFDKALLSMQTSNDVDRTAFCPPPFVRLCDVPALVTIARLFSSFLRVHRYPAFATEAHYEEVSRERVSKKHSLDEEDKDSMSESKKRVVEVKSEHGIAQGIIVADTSTGAEKPFKISFHVAKPGHATNLVYGLPSDIPTTHGIHFPYIDELSKTDKDTVPRVIERYFIRCLGRNTEDCLKNYSDIVQAWKSSICSTHWGRQMSHTFRLIEIAIPAQARIFPIIDSGLYCGSFMSGAAFSVGMGKDILRPDDYAKSFTEISCYGTNDTLINEIGTVADVDEDQTDEFRDEARKGIRALAKWLDDNKSFEPVDRDRIRKLALQLRTTTPYRVPNVQGILWMVNGIKSGQLPDESEPQYPASMFETDIFSSYLSSFGALSPSPDMPGGSLLKLNDSGKLPEGFNKVLAMRMASLEVAVADWKKVLKEGQVHNGFANLSAPYEYSTITGKDAKQNWFACLCEFSKWYKAQSSLSKGSAKVSAPVAETELDWNVIEEGLNFDDF